MSILQVASNIKHKPFSGVYNINDHKVIDAIQNYFDRNKFADIISNCNVKLFLNDYFDWFKQTNHDLLGIEQYNSLAFCLGTTNAFDMFVINYPDKKLATFKGEYSYHNILTRTQYGKPYWIENVTQLNSQNILTISVPFSDTGNEPLDLEFILEYCDNNNIKVLIDMAYANISEGIRVNLDHSCIDTVTTSLSKCFPLSHVKVGMRMQKTNIDDGIDMITSTDYVNKLGISIGHHLIKNFDPNYISNTYRAQQHNLCKQLDIESSKTVIFGVDHKNKYPEYNRGSSTNRLCLSKHFQT